MTDPKARAKAAKKKAKAEFKTAKKQMGPPAPASPSAPKSNGAGQTAAQRSAVAAEKQVRLQRLRVLIALLTLVVALATFLIAARPWNWSSTPPADPPSTERADDATERTE